MQEQPSYRVERINELIRRELVTLLKNETKDPRLQSVNVTDVLASRDLSSAKVFYTVAESEQIIVEPLLIKASGFFSFSFIKSVRFTPYTSP